MSGKMCAGSAGDRTSAKIASDADREFQNRRNHNYAFSLIEQLLRNPVGDVHNFFEHLTTGFKAFLFPAFIRCERGTCKKDGDDKKTAFSHGTTPKHLVDSFLVIGRSQLS